MSFVLAFTALALASAARAQNQTSISWQQCPELNRNITLSNGVEGTPFDCGHLSVPLDYTDPNSSEMLELDLFIVNATKEPVLGSVLINFGGPGGTGAENLPVLAKEMAYHIGDQWNLVSWDPRGTGKTIPFNCQVNTTQSSPPSRKRDINTLASTNLTDYLFNGGWDYAADIADACYAAMNDTGHLIGTAFVARDMMQIVDALGEDGLLRYYGWSYGTALGSYVAAMFPDRVERIVLDANVDPHDYQAGHYGDFLRDADKTFAAFLQECLNNRDNCALAQYTNATTTQEMLDAINLLVQPLAANASTSQQAFAPYEGVKAAIYNSLYYPSQWPTLADTITSVLNATYQAPAAPTTVPYNQGATWAVYGIRAGDALWRTDSIEEYLPRVKYQDNLGTFDTNYPHLWVSARWKMNAKEQYKGDFKVKTKHPILYVNGEYDPATPIFNARNASKSFEGSVVLGHNGYGHGLVEDPSECMARYVRAYFQNGTLPEPNTPNCEPNQGPWAIAAAKDSSNGNNGSSEGNNSMPMSNGAESREHSSSARGLIAFVAVLVASGVYIL